VNSQASPRAGTGAGGARRPARASPIPALAALLLVVLVVLVVGLVIGVSPDESTGTAIALHLGAVAAIGSGPGAEDPEVYKAVLSSPLPTDAVKVHVPILMYHYVDETPPPAGPYADELTVRTGDFEEELRYLVDNGFHTVSLADVYLAMAGEKSLPTKPVALTFDDGGLDNYEVAFPMLKRYGVNATFFIITGSVGREGQMGWDQLREMAAQGMSIQSHSVSHPDLTAVSDKRLQSELTDSRAAITEALGELGYVLCYPSGAYDERVIEAAKAAGYVMGVVTDQGKVLDPGAVFEIRRSRVQAFLPLTTFATLVD
jgi:peptidoglycan/xylan/chitin deacetylase (PgdA/CDA1 family)